MRYRVWQVSSTGSKEAYLSWHVLGHMVRNDKVGCYCSKRDRSKILGRNSISKVVNVIFIVSQDLQEWCNVSQPCLTSSAL